MRIDFVTARRSFAPPAALAIAAVSVFLAIFTQAPGVNLWPDLVTGLSAASVYAGTIAAGVAALEANRWNAVNETRLKAGVRSPAVARIRHAGAIIGTLLAGYLVALVALALFAFITATYGEPSPWWLLALAAANVLAAAAGYTAGALLPQLWFVSPAAALGFFGAYMFARSAPAPFGVTALFPAVTSMDSVFVRHLDTTLASLALCWLALSAILLATVPWAWRRAARPAIAGVVLVAAVAAVFGATQVVRSNGQVTEGFNARDFVCRSEGVSLCVNAGYAASLDPLFDRVAAMNAIVGGTDLEATALEQNVEGAGDEPSPGARSIYIEQLADDQDLAFALFRYVTKYGATEACLRASAGGPDMAALSAVFYVDSWITGFDDSSQGLPEPERLGALRELAPEAGRDWFVANADAYFSCSLQLDDLP